MIIYNVTVKLDAAIAAGWLHWLRTEHLPLMMKTGCFTDSRVVRLLEVDDSDGPTYAIQYHADSKADYNRYMTLHAPDMSRRSFEKWGDRFIAFQSVMEVIQ